MEEEVKRVDTQLGKLQYKCTKELKNAINKLVEEHLTLPGYIGPQLTFENIPEYIDFKKDERLKDIKTQEEKLDKYRVTMTKTLI